MSDFIIFSAQKLLLNHLCFSNKDLIVAIKGPTKRLFDQNKKFLQDKTTRDDSDYMPGNTKLDGKFKEESPIKGPRCKYEERAKED